MNNFSIQSIYNWYRNTIRNPKYRWWVILGSLLYLFSPIDIAPDFLPIIGWIDDGVILTLLVSEVSQMLAQRLKSRDEEVVAEADVAGVGSTANSDTVDVKAVPVK
ncbi:YkvA family protein [Coleofasciculus sp. H7-2]|uniref:YkvA family protein n=1 Tax=Coleofasciculus sp. H7-2 TaxID=3351545 RepID=UPI00366C6527